MHISVRMTIHILFVWVFVMHISVRMTIHLLMGFRHAHLCTNDYPFLVVWVFVMHISVRMTFHIHMGFRPAHFCTNDYSAPDECHFRNWRNFLVQPLVLGPTVDTYVESH